MKHNKGKKSALMLIAGLISTVALVLLSLSGGNGSIRAPAPETPSAPTPTPLPTPTAAAEPTSTPTPALTPEPQNPEEPAEPSVSPEEPGEYVPEPLATVTVAIGGDVLPYGRIGVKIVNGEYDAVLDAATAERMRAADVTMINLETSVSDRGEPIADKAYTFRSPPGNLSFLTQWLGVDVVSIANNHTLDYGWDAFQDTITNLDEYGIAHTGAGGNIAEAAKPYVAEAGGIKIAFFAANQVLTYTDWTAGSNKAGQLIARESRDLGALGDAIAAAKLECDYIVVYMHWGIELDSLPYERQTTVAHALVDAGADVVIGSHPHVVQSFEYYNGKPIIYSVGNFLFNALHPETVVIFLRFDTTNSAVTIEAVPAGISGTLTYALEGDARRRLFDKWEEISSNVIFRDDGTMAAAG